MEDSQWKVDAKGGPDQRSWEITVIRADNLHGFRSYGWIDECKIFISGSGGPCHYAVPKIVWDRLIRCAEEVAAELNKPAPYIGLAADDLRTRLLKPEK